MNKTKKLLTAIAVCLVIIGALIINRGCANTANIPNNFNFKTDWKPDTPQFIRNKIKIKYSQSKEKQNAMEQYAFALWMTIGENQDLQTANRRLDRALDCTYFHDIPYEDKRELEAELFFTDELARKYLEWNAQFNGQIIQGRDYDETSCD